MDYQKNKCKILSSFKEQRFWAGWGAVNPEYFDEWNKVCLIY